MLFMLFMYTTVCNEEILQQKFRDKFVPFMDVKLKL